MPISLGPCTAGSGAIAGSNNWHASCRASILGSAIVFVDSTVVNVALPAIKQDLGGCLALQQWVVDAYLLTLGALILVGLWLRKA